MNTKDSTGQTVVETQGVSSADVATSVLNQEELLSRCLGNVDLAERLLNRFQTEFARGLEELEQLVEAKDSETVCRVSHRLKGAAANISAADLQSALDELHEFGKNEDLDDGSGLLGRLSDEYNRFLLACPALFDSTSREAADTDKGSGET